MAGEQPVDGVGRVEEEHRWLKHKFLLVCKTALGKYFCLPSILLKVSVLQRDKTNSCENVTPNRRLLEKNREPNN